MLIVKKLLKSLVVVGALAGSLGGCAYGGMTTAGDKVVIARNDLFLFGALRKIFVCKVSDAGVTGCVNSAERP
jgi:hypothetical protein